MRIASQKVIDSARGAPCTARFPGICNHDPETSVWCHLNGGRYGKGMGMKAHDVAGFVGCSSCHEYYDRGHGTKPVISTDTLLECLLGAVVDSYVRLIILGIVTVPQDKPKAWKAPKRKPPGKRAPIPQRKSPWPAGRKLQSRPVRQKETCS